MMEHDAKIYIAGHTGMVGSAIVRKLRDKGYSNLLLRTHTELDLTDQRRLLDFFESEQPKYVFDAAAKVGGIKANNEAPADYFYENMQIENNLLGAAHHYGVRKLLFLGSACMYPKECRQPMKEEDLLTGLPEYTNEGYALAKICGSRLCSYYRRQYGDDFISAIPANAYGPGDTFDPVRSHVIPALIKKYHDAKLSGQNTVAIWGSGCALREFIYVDDLADACFFLMEHYSDERPINVGTSEEISIMDLAHLIGEVIGYPGKTVCDSSKPDGMPRRIVDNSRLNALGWIAKTNLQTGVQRMYKSFLTEEKNDKRAREGHI